MFFQLFIFAAVAALVSSVVTIHDCPRQLLRSANLRAFGQSCYTFHADRTREFNSAENYCRLKGGHLVKIRDASTQDFLYNTMHRDFHYYGAVWIGLSDSLSEGHFLWIDGSPATYTNWAPGQPDSVLGIIDSLQNCVYMDTRDRGRWHDGRCNQHFGIFHYVQKPFICEYPVVKHTTPTIIKTSTPQPSTTMMIPSSTVETTQQPSTEQPITASGESTPPQATTLQPTTNAPQPSTPPPMPTSTPQPTTITGAATTLQQGTTPEVEVTATPIPSESSTPEPLSVSASGCPPFHCSNDCGLGGYAVDDNGCLTCGCNV